MCDRLIDQVLEVSGTFNHFTLNLEAPGNREHPNRTGPFARRVHSIQQDESLAKTFCGLAVGADVGPAPPAGY